jgi:hypothetical protein
MREEAYKALFTLAVTVTTLGLGWLVGAGITSQWEQSKKRRALELEALAKFYTVYGEFFAIWKVWDAHQRDAHMRGNPLDRTAVWDLLRRAAEAEGGFEAILVRITQERFLDESQTDSLARFRQGYQSLREAIREDRTLEWRADPRKRPASDKYRAFKILAARTAGMLSDDTGRVLRRPRTPDPGRAAQALIEATSVANAARWWEGVEAAATIAAAPEALLRSGTGPDR